MTNWAAWFLVTDASDRAVGQSAANVRQHLIDRMRDRAISLADLNQLRLWIETQPEVPEGAGIRTSAHSKSAATAHTPRRSWFRARLRRASLFDRLFPSSLPDLRLRTHAQFPSYSRPFPSPKYRSGVVPNCFRNMDMNALGLL